MEPFGVDKNGTIITEVSLDKIAPSFKPIVADVLDSVVQKFRHQLDGIYLYGSVVTGKAVLGKSDLDSILVFKAKANSELLDAVKSLEAGLSKKYTSELRNVGLESTDIADLRSEKERFGGMCFMKHLCVCAYGNDLAKGVPGFKPSNEVARGFNGDIGPTLDRYRTKITGALTELETRNLSQSVAKKIIRTGFSLVMPRSKSWTTDSETSYEVFVKYYPEKTSEMSMALSWSRSGSTDKEAILEFIDTFGKWLAEEFQRIIPIT